MKDTTPKTTDDLMSYLREQKNIAIDGDVQKRQLMNMGYYHGYKGYRYINKPSNLISYSNFNELLAIYEFDAQIKSLFYPFVMKLETAFKNYVLETIVAQANSDNFIEIYNTLLDNYKEYSTSSKVFVDDNQRADAERKYKDKIKKRLELRNQIYKVQTKAFDEDNKIVKHYFYKDANLPIWAIFELLNLGNFGVFVSCLNLNCRRNISKNIGIRASDDSNGVMVQNFIYAVKDLRNAIAHNDVVFDTRFKKSKINSAVSKTILNTTGVANINFETITDYLVFIVYLLSLFHFSKEEQKNLIDSFKNSTETLRKKIPINVYNQIILTNNNKKIEKLKKYVQK